MKWRRVTRPPPPLPQKKTINNLNEPMHAGCRPPPLRPLTCMESFAIVPVALLSASLPFHGQSAHMWVSFRTSTSRLPPKTTETRRLSKRSGYRSGGCFLKLYTNQSVLTQRQNSQEVALILHCWFAWPRLN